MSALEQVRRAVIAALGSAGVNAVGEYDARCAAPVRAGVVAVGLKSAGADEPCYLGLREDAERGAVEVYGRRMELALSLRAYAPRADGCEELSEAAVESLSAALPSGLRPGRIDWDATQWDERYGAFVRAGTLRCAAYFTAQAAEDGAVLEDFVLKGVVR